MQDTTSSINNISVQKGGGTSQRLFSKCRHVAQHEFCKAVDHAAFFRVQTGNSRRDVAMNNWLPEEC